MTVTALYLVSDTQNPAVFSTILDRLLKQFDPTPLGRWAVDHRLLRSNPVSTEDKAPPRYQHALRLNHHPGKAYFSISDPANTESGAGNATIAVPADQYDSFYNILTSKFAALWSSRSAASVHNGVAYSLGDFVVRLGELRKGVVVCIQATPQSAAQIDGNHDTASLDGEDGGMKQEEDEIQTTQALIRVLWKDFGVEGAKEMMTASKPQSDAGRLFEEIRMWCELLRVSR